MRRRQHLSHISGSRSKNDKWFTKQEIRTWISLSKTLNLFKIVWTVIKKSRPEQDPKWTRLCVLLHTGSRLWRHFWSKYKEYRGLYCGKFWSCRNFQEFTKRSFCDSEASDSSSGMDGICSWPEVADVVISGGDVDNHFRGQWTQMSNASQNKRLKRLSLWINLFEINWTVIKQSRPELAQNEHVYDSSIHWR